MFQRIKRIIKLSSKDPKSIDAITDEEINDLPDIGDGKAVFFGDGSEEEFKEQTLKDKGFIGRIFGL